VVDGADEVVVTLQGGQKLEAMLVGSDATTDLALLKVEPGAPLTAVAFGDSDLVRVGEWVLAIGNPFGLGGTATAGIVSARGRDIRSGPYDDYLQIDAAINSGNSGGPVFSTAGQVVGINTAIFSPNGGNIGIGFAIPANQASAVVEQLKASGRVERGWLGVDIQALDPELAASLDLPSASGALVAQVMDDSPARGAGIEPGDVITRFGDTTVEAPRDLSRAVGTSPPGQRTAVRLWRDGRERTVQVTLGETDVGAASALSSRAPDAPATANALGLVLRPLDPAMRARLGIESDVRGVVVAQVDPAGPAAAKGIRPGDIVTRIGQQDIASVDEAQAALQDAPSAADPVLLRVRRGDSQRFISIARG
jgi:serine protease Do